MKLKANLKRVPLGSLIILKMLKSDVSVEWCSENCLLINDKQCFRDESGIFRYLCRLESSKKLFGANMVQQCEVDHWISFTIGPLSNEKQFEESLTYLDNKLACVTYLVGNNFSAADVAVWSKVALSCKWNELMFLKQVPPNVHRWFTLIGNMEWVDAVVKGLPENADLYPVKENETLRKEEGKFVDLPGAEMGKVVVRFPPEASGYLHIGHAKAALLNQYYRDAFNGKLIMRFDDTNPAKEKVDFEKVILEDLSLLKVKYDLFSHTSDHFDLLLEKCEELIKKSKAYVDNTDPEVMKNEREQKTESANRNNSIEKNLEMWEEMKKGTDFGQKCCVRAKIDMNSLNGCMRDPTIYRCKNEPHPKTGSKYKVYPTYDFACPIVDSIEGVTHCLRTMEYHDRDDQFYWFIDVLGLRKPYIWEYSRLNMTNTVLSKRKLTWFVENGYVEGWDDPRMPTVRGVLRRGMTVEGLKQFIIAQGSSRSVVLMEWDKIWAINKKVIDPIAPRYTAVDAVNKVRLSVNEVSDAPVKALKHPKDEKIGEKTVWIGPKLWVDEVDAHAMKVGENVTLINWGNVKIKEIKKKGNKIEEIIADPNFEDKNYKKTLKITWLADTPQAPLIDCYCVYFEHLISKPILGKDEDFKNYIDHNTRIEVKMLGDPELINLKKSEIIQIQRKGFFICDVPYSSPSIYTGVSTPVILFSIPDGHTKEMPTTIPAALKEEVKKQPNEASQLSDEALVSINTDILAQGDVVRKLKQDKAPKSTIEEEVKKLLKLKELFKSTSGMDWKPDILGASNKVVKERQSLQQESALNEKISALGNVIRSLKSEKAEKEVIANNVKELLKLKEEYKNVVGREWTPETKIQKQALDKEQLSSNIKLQGDKVRDLKNKKAPKSEVDKEVAVLLSLKSEYKSLTGEDWKPENAPSQNSSTVNKNELDLKIRDQGNKVRELKNAKSAKNIIDSEVAKLLSLKAEYKALTGTDWKADAVQLNNEKNITKPKLNGPSLQAPELDSKIRTQGDLVRSLKAKKSEKSVIDAEVAKLLSLKAEFKSITGQDWKPDTAPKIEQPSDKSSNSLAKGDNVIAELDRQVKEQGDAVRQLKSTNGSKDQVNEAVQKLLGLKAEYKKLTGNEYVSEGQNQTKKSKPKKETKTEPIKKQETKKKEQISPDKESSVKKVTRLGLEALKEENLPDWYSQVITKGELIEYYDVSGCYILRPWSYSIWESIKDWLDKEFKALGVKNCYFPIFVSKSVLEKEKTHIADFAPEVAWVTKSGESDLAEPIAIRPTSETVMYPAYAKWIQSYRDLPIKLNQWNNVVRWEFKHPQPFLRTREFLWQEGHTAYASSNEAEEEVRQILELYAKVYTDLLAVPVIKGRKTEKEKFAGGDYTLTVEAFISASGRAIQGATSHHLGQNFSKMFDIIYEDPETQEKKFVYQNSWGMTTRTIGVMIMIHADNQGLVLPPRVASVQVVIVPCGITASLGENEKEKLLKTCKNVETELKTSGVRVEGDYRDNYSPGWKFNHWELKGVPIRIEIGPKDMQLNQVIAVRRDTGSKTNVSSSTLVKDIQTILEDIHSNLLNKSTEDLTSHTIVCKDWVEFCKYLDKKCILLSPFCGDMQCEDVIKERSARSDAEADAGAPSMGAKSLCIPFEQPNNGVNSSDKCINPECSLNPKFYTLFGRSY